MSGVLRNRAFRWVAAVYLLDALLEWFGSIALMVLVYQRGDSTAAAAALLLSKQVAPAAVVPSLGAALDRWSTRHALALLFAVQATMLALVGWIGFSWIVFPLAFVAGAAGILVRSIVRAGTASILDGDERRHGNAFINVALAVTGLLGPASAGFVVAVFGAQVALVVAAVTVGMCGILALRVPNVAEADDDEATTSPSAAVSPVSLRLLLVLVGVVTYVFSMEAPALLAYSETSIHAGVAGYGAIDAAWGAGLVIGGLIFSRLVRLPMLRVYAAATTITSIAFIGMGLAPSMWLAGFWAIVAGLGNGMDWIALVTAVQEAAPRGAEASASRSLEAIVRAAGGFGILSGGLLAQMLTPRAAFLVPGGLVLFSLATGLLVLRLRNTRLVRAEKTIFSPSIPGGSA